MSGKITSQEIEQGAISTSLGFTPENSANKGVANGYASLNSSGIVPTTQLPSLNFVPTSAEGTANGVATLDANAKVPLSQLGNIPVASTTQVGEVKIGNGIAVQSDGTISTKIDPLLIWMSI